MTTQFIVNHLWQSTCFVLLAGLLAFALRRNSPKVRYWVWLSASLKFLLPLALLVSLGSAVPRPARRAAVSAAPAFSNTVVIEIAAPFTIPSYSSAPVHAPIHWVPIAIGVVWALGFAAITFVRCRTWFRIKAALRSSTPVELPIPIPAFIAPGAEEPGIVGFLRPVLVLPANLLEHLNPPQLDAVLAHELCHVRRRDNLFAAVHMIVEAIFWFHPLVWWIGSRMVEERELACDEDVLRMGHEPADYVEGILKVCRFYKESPLPCVSGVTGANVKKRLRAILAGTIARDLSFGRKVALALIGFAALAAPIVVGVLNAPRVHAQSTAQSVVAPAAQAEAAGPLVAQKTVPKAEPQAIPPVRLQFEVASVRIVDPQSKPPVNGGLAEFNFGPMNEMEDTINAARKAAGIDEPRDPNRIVLPYATLAMVLQLAFGVGFHQSVHLQGAPDWVDNQWYTIQAITPAGTTASQAQEMVRNLLMDRFGMKFHTEARPAEVYEISRDDKQPLKLEESTGPATLGPPGFIARLDSDGVPAFPPGVTRLNIFPTHARLQAVNLSMSEVVKYLGSALNAEVIDKTGLTGKYDFQLDFDPELNREPPPYLQPAPPLDKALRSLGLALTKKKGEVQVTVIDRLNKIPSGN